CRQLQARGAGQTVPWPFDAAGQHLYLDQGGATSGNHLSQYLDNLEVVLQRYGGAPHAITVTEAAWSTTAVSQDVQASNLRLLCARRPLRPLVLCCRPSAPAQRSSRGNTRSIPWARLTPARSPSVRYSVVQLPPGSHPKT